ncbi:MAG: polyprenyl synthetase family protein [Anaerolineales bacterium]|nr:polyprenyl synthetase family protein [Anaerolineales bacterium]
MDKNPFQDVIQSVPVMGAWPELTQLITRFSNRHNADWQLPLKVCAALGGDETAVLPGAAALAALQLSIIFVDDMLDNDPRGEYRRRGHGVTANLAQALQAAAFQFIAQAPVSDVQRAAAVNCLAKMALDTARGQDFDVQNLPGEAGYWQIVEAKSTPFYGACYQLGAILSGADEALCARFYEFGALTGEIIQLNDDLADAFQTPANADWREGRNNLLLLYAQTAVHPERERFLHLLPRIDDPDALKAAQQILISSGAVSYCAYQLIERHREAHELLTAMHLPNSAPIRMILDAFTTSLQAFLEISDMVVTPEILFEAQVAL